MSTDPGPPGSRPTGRVNYRVGNSVHVYIPTLYQKETCSPLKITNIHLQSYRRDKAGNYQPISGPVGSSGLRGGAVGDDGGGFRSGPVCLGPPGTVRQTSRKRVRT